MSGSRRRFSALEEMRSVLTLAVPIAALQTGLLLYGTVDTLFAGRLGRQAIATVGLSASTYFVLMIAAFGLLLGIDPLSARAFGAGRRHECAETLIHAMCLALLAALPVFAALSCAGWIFAAFGIEPRLAASAAAFLLILRWSIFPALLFTACRQYLQTLNIAWPQFAAVVIGNVLNFFLDYALMFGHFGFPALGVYGSAYATLASYNLMFAVIAVIAAREVSHSRFVWRGFQPDLLKGLVRVGIPSGLQMSAEGAAFCLATMFCGRMGTVAAASHQIVLNLAGLTYMIPLGVSHAAAVRVGQGLGSGQPQKAVRAGWAALLLGVAFMSLTSLAFLFLPRRIMGLYTADADVTALGVRLLAVAAFFQVFDGTQVVMTGALRGLGETRIPMWANAVGYWAVGLPVGVGLAFFAAWGAFGIWIGLCIGLCLVAISLLWAWRHRTISFC